MTQLTAPWTPEQVAALNRYQERSDFHPFTCDDTNRHHPQVRWVLVAREDGWHCPAEGCGYTQDWAYPFMLQPPPRDRANEMLEAMRAERARGIAAVAAVEELRAVFKRWFLDAHAGLTFQAAMNGLAADLQRVIEVADGARRGGVTGGTTGGTTDEMEDGS